MGQMIMTGNDETAELQQAAATLQAGGLVAIPTETVYGLAANALNAQAVAKIFAAKERPFFDPLIVHLAEESWWPRVVSDFPPIARKLAAKFWPGPLTMILPKASAVPPLVTSGLMTVGVRVPDHPLAQKLLRLADLPVAAPSANPFGRLSPTTADHVRDQLGNRVEMILDGGPCRVGVESTIVQIQGDVVTLLRPGGVPLEEIEAVIGRVQQPAKGSQQNPLAPGMLDSHYAPRTPLKIVDQLPLTAPARRTGILTLSTTEESTSYTITEVLSQRGNLIEAAANFFQALHRLDQAQLDLILATPFPDEGLGRALNDRLRRAAH
jgi:L-threonylcarbamoyladenylate synthase